MDAEGITVPAPRWTRKIMGTKHGDWQPYHDITSHVFAQGADVGLLVHDHCIIDGDRVMPLVLDHDGVVWISETTLGGVDSVTFTVCQQAIIDAGLIISSGRLNERLVARAKEIVLLGTGMGAAKLTVLDDIDIGDGSNTLQKICISALGKNWH
jgi:branched-subunit amino acid aminotransferase/4-amino-4-deoxychorismate lyase